MPSMPGGGAAPFSYLHGQAGVSQTVNNNSLTTLTLSTPRGYSPDWPAANVPAAGATIITIPFSGFWFIVIHDIDWADTGVAISTGVRRVGTVLSGGVTTRRMAQTQVGAGGSATNQSVESGLQPVYLPVGETVSFICLQTSATTLTVAGMNYSLVNLIPNITAMVYP